MRTITATFHVTENTRTSELIERVKTLAAVSRTRFGHVEFHPPTRQHDGLTVKADIDIIGHTP